MMQKHPGTSGFRSHFLPVANAMLRASLLAGIAGIAVAPICTAQTPSAAPEAISTNDVRPAIGQVSQTVTGVNVSRWKAPNDVKDSTQQDLNSIQRDLNSTLPGLLDASTANPTAVGPAFAVYRNIDALYDVLLRVAETATLAGSQADAGRLQEALNQLQSARTAFGNSILQAASARDTEVVQLRTAVAHAAQAAPAPAPQKIVVDDGPASKPAPPKRKKKPAPTTPSADANGTQAQPQTPPQ